MNKKKKTRSDKEIILEIIELYLELLKNEIDVKPFADNEARENFKKHISGDIEASIRSSDEYLSLKVVLTSQDSREKIEKTIKTFLEMLKKKGITMNIDSDYLENYLERWTVRHMRRK